MIGTIEAVFKNIKKDAIYKIAEAQKTFCDNLCQEIKDSVEIPPDTETRNPGQFEIYRNSIKTSETEVDGNEITTKIYSDYTVYWPKKGINVPVGAFLEWGTGPLGEETNTYDHGYPYTTDFPWDETTSIQQITTGTWGIQARPHFFPAYMRNKYKFKEEIEKAING